MSKIQPCACNTVRFDLSGDMTQIEEALAGFPKKYKDMLPSLPPVKDEAGWVYVEPAEMCGFETKSTFAPGHDARMASLAGWAIHYGVAMTIALGEGMITSGDPGEMIEQIASTALRVKAEGVASNLGSKGKKVKDRKAAVRRVRIKVGRWEYDATIDTATKDATYVSKNGETVTVMDGVYKLINDTVVAE